MRRTTLLILFLFSLALFAACGGSGGGDSAGTTLAPAPIDAVDIRVAESFPPQYFVRVVSGLSNGCVRFERYTTDRQDRTITIAVTNRLPADKDVICSQIYRTVEHNIALGSNFVRGATYTLRVNDVMRTFVAQ